MSADQPRTQRPKFSSPKRTITIITITAAIHVGRWSWSGAIDTTTTIITIIIIITTIDGSESSRRGDEKQGLQGPVFF
jgi:hypothetical protein